MPKGTNPWFRMYAEFLYDPKVQMLNEVNQRRYVMLLCLRCENGDKVLTDDEVAFSLRIQLDAYLDTKRILIDKGLIDRSNQPKAWDRRQYRSDSSTDRVRRFRQDNDENTSSQAQLFDEGRGQQPHGSDGESSPVESAGALEVKHESPSAHKKSGAAPKPRATAERFDEWWNSLPTGHKKGRPLCLKIWQKRGLDEQADTLIADTKRRAVEDDNWVRGYIPNPSTYLNQSRWEDDITPPKPQHPGGGMRLGLSSDKRLIADSARVAAGGGMDGEDYAAAAEGSGFEVAGG